MIPILVHNVMVRVVRAVKLARIPNCFLKWWDQVVLARHDWDIFRGVNIILILDMFESKFDVLIVEWIEIRVRHLKHQLLGG